MKNKIYIFFSWQSDVPDNRFFIDRKIKEAITEIKGLPEMSECNITYDHSTQNRSGSPDIVSTVHSKINQCDVFIADITPIVSIESRGDDKEKLIPNPNVMEESGFALRAIGENRIIFLMRKDKGRTEDLPFDIRHRRINRFDVKNNKYKLTAFLLSAIKFAQSSHENEHEANILSHDTKIFNRLNDLLIDEHTFMTINETIVNNQRISKWECYYFANICEYLNQVSTQFIIPELRTKAQNLYTSITTLTNFTAGRFAPMYSQWHSEDDDMSPEEIIKAQKNSYYSWIDKGAGEYLEEELYHKKLDEIVSELGSCYDNITLNYKQLRQSIKENLFI